MFQPKNLWVIMFFLVSCVAAFTVANRENIVLIGECLDAGNDFDYQAWVCVEQTNQDNNS